VDAAADAVRIRPGTAKDASRVLAVDRNEGRAEWVRAVLDERSLVAEVRGEIVGFCVHGEFYGCAFLELLFVADNHRRRGIGTALVRAWEEQADSPKLFTSTNQSNLPMQQLCEQLGYVRSGVIENLYEGGPELVYFKPAAAMQEPVG
jgi:GNAT superfamily N-acetyltransferase